MSTVPDLAVTSRTKLVWPPNRSLISCCALVDWAAGSSNPPFLSLPNAPPPNATAAMSRIPEMTSRSRARRTTNSPYLCSMTSSPNQVPPGAVADVHGVNLPHNANAVNIGQDRGMATQTRRGSYHHGDLANAPTRAATELARQGGPGAGVLAQAAPQAGGSAPPAPARHSANQGDLIQEVKDHCQALLAESMDAELATTPATDDPETAALNRLRALGLGYLRFALAEPGLFRTAFCHTGSPREKL